MKLSLPNPVRLIFGPIFQKEVRVMGRRRGTYLSRSLLTIGMLALVAFWFAGALADHSEGIHRLQSLQAIAPMLTLVIFWFQFIILALLAPMLTSTGISEERHARTLPALLTTPLTASQIVFGKISSRLVQIVVLVLLAVPLLLALRLFGGVSAHIVLAATAVILSTAILGAALGLLASLGTRHSGGAAQQALLALGIIQFGPLIFASLRLYFLHRMQIPVTFNPDLSPTASWLVMAELSQSAFIGYETRNITITLQGWSISLGPIWVVNAAYNLAAAFGIAVLTSIMLRRTMLRMANEVPAPVKRRFLSLGSLRLLPSRSASKTTDTPSLPEGSEILRSTSRTLHGSPILWRELRQQTLGSRRTFMLAMIAVIGGLGLAYWYIGLEDRDLHIGLAVIGAIMLLSQAAYSASGNIAAEREGRTWEDLLVTPLPPHRIVLDKFLGALRGQWFIITVLALHFAIAMFAAAIQPRGLWQIVLILVGPLIFLTASGQFLALAFRRGITAAALNLIVATSLYIGTFIALVCIAMLLRDEPPWFERLINAAYAINPVAMSGSAVDGACTWGRSRQNYQLAVDSVSPDTFTIIVLVVFTCYIAAAAGTLALACRLFNRFTGRAS